MMKRFFLQLVSIPTAFVVGLFYWVGSQSFTSSGEKTTATVVYYYCVLLVFAAVANFFTESLFWPHALLTLGAILIVVATFGYSHALHPELKFW
jgi:hypothetical protein